MFVIDRFEGDEVVVEWQGKTINFPMELLPKGAREGDIINIEISLNKEATRERKESLEEKARRLWE